MSGQKYTFYFLANKILLVLLVYLKTKQIGITSSIWIAGFQHGQSTATYSSLLVLARYNHALSTTRFSTPLSMNWAHLTTCMYSYRISTSTSTVPYYSNTIWYRMISAVPYGTGLILQYCEFRIQYVHLPVFANPCSCWTLRASTYQSSFRSAHLSYQLSSPVMYSILL